MAERMKGLIQEIVRVNADFICFQEVKKHMLAEILSHPHIRSNFYVSDIDGKTLGGYGCVCNLQMEAQNLINLLFMN